MKTAFLLIWFSLNSSLKGDCKKHDHTTGCTIRTEQFQTYDEADQAAKKILSNVSETNDTAVIHEIATGKTTAVQRKVIKTLKVQFKGETPK